MIQLLLAVLFSLLGVAFLCAVAAVVAGIVLLKEK